MNEKKVILELPIQNQEVLSDFVEECIKNDVEIIAVVGLDALEIEEEIDWLIIGDGSDETRFIVTTSHVDETIDDALQFLDAWHTEPKSPTKIVKI